tara:strand:- start:250 stop:2466 length:2217 start_codon:yes stop_codon:yes gene_type:complete
MESDTNKFLSQLFDPGEWVNLRTWGTASPRSALCLVGEEGEVQKPPPWVNEATLNIGFGVASRVCPNSGGGASNTGFVRALWVDIDGVNTSSIDPVAYADNAADLTGLAPNWLVLSGNGVHLYWVLDYKVPALDGNGRPNQALLSKLKHLAQKLGGDMKVCEVARIMRLPGSFNNKNDDNCVRTHLHEVGSNTHDFNDFPEGGEKQGEGGRNNRIFDEVRSMRDQGIPEEDARELAEAVNSATNVPPLADYEVAATIRSVYSRPAQVDDDGDELPEAIESSIADAFMRRHGADLRYETGMGWLYWNGTHWEMGEKADQLTKVRCRRYLMRLMADSRNRNEGLHRMCRRLLTAKGISSIVNGAALFSEYWVRAKDLDNKDHKVNTRNATATVTAEGVEYSDHDREDLLTSVIDRVSYDEEEPKEFVEFLFKVLSEDPETVRYLQKCLGACVLGNVGFSKALILFGDGANGKSVLAGVLQEVLGDYCIPVPSGTLTGKGDGGENKVACLMGKRVGLVHEFGSGASLNDERFKMLTGGEALISARLLFKNPHSFRPITSFIVLTNYLPAIKDSGHGLWRRMAPVPFSVVIPEHEQDHGLMRRMVKQEADRILSWLIRGAHLYLKEGADMPAAVESALKEYRTSEDHIGTWLFESYDPTGELGRVPLNDAYKSYNSWLKDQGIHCHFSKTNFARHVTGRVLEVVNAYGETKKSRIDKKKIGGQTVFVNLSPKMEDWAFDSPE